MSHGETIFRPGDPSQRLYLLLQGAVRLSSLDRSGQETTVSLIAPGQIFGSASLIVRGERRYLASPLGESRLCSLSADFVERQFALIPEFRMRLAESLAQRLRQAQDFTAIRSYTSVPQRLVHLLKVLARDFGIPVGSRILIRLPVTHEELARMISVTRPNVSRHLESLRQQGLLAFEGKAIWLARNAHLNVVPNCRGKTLCTTWQCEPSAVEAVPQAV